MHKSAIKRMEWFVQNYIPKDKEVNILDIGSYSVNGNYRSLFNGYKAHYSGLDITPGPNVDIVVADPYNWAELKDESFDFIISGNAFEHIEYPWLSMCQIERKLKKGGVTCILTPFTLDEHRYPTDCYRYYPDGLVALAKWAGLIVVNSTVGGVPDGVDTNQWIPSENYDDSVLIAIKQGTQSDVTNLPKLTKQVRSKTIHGGK